jgi:alpha-glucosidase
VPEVERGLADLRVAAGDRLLVGEAYLPTSALARYLRHLDLVFCFELLFAPPQADALRRAVAPALELGRAAWVLSNHDFGRAATRFGPGRERVAALLLLTLPGTAFVYQGEEIGMLEGPGGDPPVDRAGRDPARHPMQWDSSRHGGFTDGTPWLPAVDPEERNVADQENDRQSLLWLYRDAISLRRELSGPVRFLDASPGVLAYERGDHVIALNLSEHPRRAPAAGELRLGTGGEPGGRAPRELAAGHGFVARR